MSLRWQRPQSSHSAPVCRPVAALRCRGHGPRRTSPLRSRMSVRHRGAFASPRACRPRRQHNLTPGKIAHPVDTTPTALCVCTGSASPSQCPICRRENTRPPTCQMSGYQGPSATSPPHPVVCFKSVEAAGQSAGANATAFVPWISQSRGQCDVWLVACARGKGVSAPRFALPPARREPVICPPRRVHPAKEGPHVRVEALSCLP